MMPTCHSGDDNVNAAAIDYTTEIALLMYRDHMLTRAMGGIFPEQEPSDLIGCRTVLDIGSGPGSWVVEVAHAYPEMKIVGIDINETMVKFATAHALSQGLQNVHFETMDATRPLDFATNSFDIINARIMQECMCKEIWPSFLQECLRITRPGGIIRLTEGDWGVTSSPACERLLSTLARATYLDGRSFSVDGRQMGIIPMLSKLLIQAGFTNVKRKIYPFDYSFGMELHEPTYQIMMVSLRLLEPLVIKHAQLTSQEFVHLYNQTMREMLLDDFCGLGQLVTAYGRKPN
jgi:ubiquinone/menaquinone biosynthesis C-methylase UbiE